MGSQSWPEVEGLCNDNVHSDSGFFSGKVRISTGNHELRDRECTRDLVNLPFIANCS